MDQPKQLHYKSITFNANKKHHQSKMFQEGSICVDTTHVLALKLHI